MMRKDNARFSHVVWLSTFAFLGLTPLACSSSSSSATHDAGGGGKDSGATNDGGGVTGEGGGGEGGNGYPAFVPDVGTIQNHGGPMLKSPKLVTITWSTDPSAGALEDFGDKLGSSTYWQTTVGEYGIGAMTSGASNHVRVSTAPPATWTLDEAEIWLVDQINAAPAGWPALDPANIYVIYVPPDTQLSPHNTYHGEVQTTGNAHVPFVLVDENNHGAETLLDYTTANSAHEIAEAATNPHTFSDTALVDFDAQHIAWQMFVQDAEIGDICELYAGSDYKNADFPYALQRLWSNKSATAGHSPCVPTPAEPFYNVTPLNLETVSVFVNDATTAAEGLGYRIGIGEKKTITVGFHSDQPMTAPWTISAVEGNWFSPASNHRLTINVLKTTGNNGDTATIEVTANAESHGLGNAVLMTVTSEAPGLAKHTVPILIGTY